MSGDQTIRAETYYSDGGLSCEDDRLNTQWGDGLDDGNSGGSDLFIIVPDYYTPDQPDGDPSVLDSITLELNDDTVEEGTSWDYSEVSGPGVGDYGSFRLSGRNVDG